MNHEEFELAVGADPTHLTDAERAHMAECSACAAFYDETMRLEARLSAALAIDVPVTPTPRAIRPPRPAMWPFGLAAAAALVAVLVTALVISVPSDALARSVAVHMNHEPEAFTQTSPVPDEALAKVLKSAHVELAPGGPTVTYASACTLRGHLVPHLAVMTDRGPVVVMILPQETVRQRQHFNENGYRGVLVPAARGSIAIVSTEERDFDTIVSLVASRVRYLD